MNVQCADLVPRPLTPAFSMGEHRDEAINPEEDVNVRPSDIESILDENANDVIYDENYTGDDAND